MEDKEKKIKEEVAYFMRRAYERNLTTSTGGNISCRDGKYMYITCSSKDKATLSGDDIAKVDIETGENLTPELKLSIESEMHRLLYKVRDNISAVVHCHPTFSCLLSASESNVDTTLIAESWYLLGNVKKIQYKRMGSKELAQEVSGIMQDWNSALLENHGALTVGNSLLNAFDRMECLEQASKMTIFASMFGIEGMDNDKLVEIAKMRG